MRLTTNEKLVARNTKIARYATFAGLAILLGSLILSFNNNIVLAYGSLAVGFVLAYIGSILANRWIKEPRADVALEKSLKGLDNRNHLYNYLLPVSHAMITPTGILVFKIKSQDGSIAYENGKWKRPFQLSRLIGGMGQEPLGNPLAELNTEIASLKNMLADKLKNSALVPIDGYVVFSDPRVQLTLDDATLPVVKAETLKDVLRKTKRGPVLSAAALEEIEQAFKEIADAKTAK